MEEELVRYDDDDDDDGSVLKKRGRLVRMFTGFMIVKLNFALSAWLLIVFFFKLVNNIYSEDIGVVPFFYID